MGEIPQCMNCSWWHRIWLDLLANDTLFWIAVWLPILIVIIVVVMHYSGKELRELQEEKEN